MSHLNYNHLYYFWHVYKQGSVVGAAEALYLTPQTITGQIKALEERLQGKLFKRKGRGIEPSELGELVFRYADKMFTLSQEMLDIVNYRKESNLLFDVGVADALSKRLVSGVLDEMGSVSSGISPDTAVFIPYETGIKYITGDNVSPTITVIAEDVNNVDNVITNIETVLADSYANAEFTISDAGTKMEAASKSNETLQMLLIAMAIIVFIVGGIGIMNVLFVSVKERTNEIGILKALGCSKRDILLEFLMEACFMSLIGAILGVLLALGITPVVERMSVRVELSVSGAVLSLAFGVITGTIFGFYPAYKASTLIPVVALNQE